MNIREWTLPVYTILTQLSVGALFVIWVIRMLTAAKLGLAKIDQSIRITVLILLLTMIVAIIFAHFHLSRPYLSFLALRNLSSSWLSRELLANLLYILSAGLLVFTLWFVQGGQNLVTVLGWVAIAAGVVTEYCMAKIYVLPSQPYWNSNFTSFSFLVTTCLLGVLTIPVIFMMDLIFQKSQARETQAVHAELLELSLGRLAIAAIPLCILMAMINYFQIADLLTGTSAAQASLNLLLNIYQPLLIMRLILSFIGVGWLGVTAMKVNQNKFVPDGLLLNSFIACLLVMVAEILGRFLFYAIHVRIGI